MSPAASQALRAATYELLIRTPEPVERGTWQQWLEDLRATPEILYELTTKSGKTQVVNLRDRLLEIRLKEHQDHWPMVSLIYTGVCRNDGTFLRPEHCLYLLEKVSGHALELGAIARQKLHLETP